MPEDRVAGPPTALDAHHPWATGITRFVVFDVGESTSVGWRVIVPAPGAHTEPGPADLSPWSDGVSAAVRRHSGQGGNRVRAGLHIEQAAGVGRSVCDGATRGRSGSIARAPSDEVDLTTGGGLAARARLTVASAVLSVVLFAGSPGVHAGRGGWGTGHDAHRLGRQ